MQPVQPIVYKAVILGDYSVGKSAFFSKTKAVNPQNATTIGIDTWTFKYEPRGGLKVSINLWDTSGQVVFRDIAVTMITGSKGCIVMFDLTKRDTFLSVQSFWKTNCDRQAGEGV